MQPLRPQFEPIAIVGQSCILPGALDPGALWAAVVEGRDLTSTAPADRWGLDRRLALSDPPGRAADRTWCDWGGYVRGFDEVFDAEGFAVPAEEIRSLDPLFRWVLHTGREALRGAGDGDRERTGVVLGNLSFPTVGASRFAEAVWLGQDQPVSSRDAHEVDPRDHFMSGLPAHLLARALGLGGAAFALDAACASSLVALKLACDRLHDRRADVMLAGAVSCADDLFIHIGFCALEALSPSGRSRPFHAAADGLLPAEGAAFVALRRLSDAVARGDEILGVIRGIGLSNDGRGGVLAPSEAGQVRAIRRAYEISGLGPADVSLVECHATGTRLGDATEIRSLSRLYSGRREVPIGSLKSNLGHPITTAGLAGLLKALAAMRAGVRPPTLHAETPNPALDGSPFRLLQQAEPWPSQGPRRTALSAFGFGGNNAHLLVEEWLPEGPQVAASTPRALPKSAVRPNSAQPAAETPIAIVGLAAMAADASDAKTGTGGFARLLFSGESRLRERPDGTLAGLCDSIELPLAGLGFPPNDLRQSLPQQLVLLATAQQARASLASDLPRQRTGVWIGMRCDAEIARYGLRWRLAGWGADLDPRWVADARDSIVGALQAAGVVGTMPNMTANRLNSQLDLGGPSASVSAEELSGLVALELATRALRCGDLDAALVGAADFSCEPVHEAAVRELIGERIPGDAATVLVLKRLADARRDGDRIVAVIEDVANPAALRAADGLRLVREGEADTRLDLTPRFGLAHAATGLLHVAAAALACQHRAQPPAAPQDEPTPWLSRGPRRAEVSASALEGRRASVRLRDEPSHCASLEPADGWPRIHLYRGADRAEVLARLTAGQAETPEAPGKGAARLVLVARTDDELAGRREAARRLLSGDGDLAPGPATPRGVYFREAPLAGELAFVFTGAGAAYRGMGRQLLLALPQLLDRLRCRMADTHGAAGWVYRQTDAPPDPLQQLWGSSFLSQVHSELSRGLLGLEPAAVIGYSSGESNALMAMGAWNDLDALHRDTVECGLFTHELGGSFAAAQRHWRPPRSAVGEWANHMLNVTVERVEAALMREEQAYLTLVNSPDEVVIGGEAVACQRVIEALGAPAHPLGYDLAVHCPVVEEVAERWLELHRRETADVPDVRFYTHSTLGHYHPTRESAARAILGQAVRTLRFPALIQQAFDDGVRIFLEHGPRGLCSGWIHKILSHHGVAEDDYLAVPFDRGSGSSLHQAAEATARLLAAGVDLHWDVFHRPADDAGAGAESRATARDLAFPAHWPPVRLPPLPAARPPKNNTETPMSTLDEPQIMAPAPSLPPVLGDGREAVAPSAPAPAAAASTPAPVAASPAPVQATTPLAAGATAAASLTTASVESPVPPAMLPPLVTAVADRTIAGPVSAEVLARVADLQGRIADAQKGFLSSQTEIHRQFLALRQKTLADLLQARGEFPAHLDFATAAAATAPAPVIEPAAADPYRDAIAARSGAHGQPAEAVESAAEPMPAPAEAEPEAQAVAVTTATFSVEAQPAEAAASRVAPAPAASSEISAPANGDLPGPKISRQELEVLASGCVSSIFGPLFERQDGYSRQTRMPEPPFLLADRVTGIDAEPGSMGTGTIWTETDVTPDSWYLHRGHMPGGLMIEAGQADLLLISWLGVDFLNRNERVYRLLGCELTYRGGLPRPGDTLRYDIHVDGHAQQGDVRLFFFHYDCHIGEEVRLEVRHGQAGFFTDDELAHSAGVLWSPEDETPPEGRLDPAPALSRHRSFSHRQLQAFSLGRLVDCMGPGFELAAAHSLTPKIQGGRMLLLDRITDFQPQGGPWQRGYLRAVTAIHADSWIFEGHFKNDPCMPGTLMLEGCFQALAFYLAANGFTLERDGWRFEPVPDETYLMRCRGQAIPTSKELVYELFVHEIVAGPRPTVFADLLCTVDGLKAFHARRLGLRLVPDWPLNVVPELLDQPFPGGERPSDRPVAASGDFAFDYPSLLACAWGKPSDAFGEMYRVFDGPRRVARLPGPPYHYMSRIARIDGEMGRFEPGAVLEAEYDVPPEEWYFADNGHPTMPFAVLMEAGLQPCGWLASYVGSALTTPVDLQFRNLDGTGTLSAEVDPASGTLRSRVKLVATSSSAGVLIVRFEVEMRDDQRPIFQMETAFGFFPAAAMQNQVGLPASDEERGWLERAADFEVDLTARPERYCSGSLALAGPRLLMLDRVTGYWPEAGQAGLGRLRAEKTVDPGEWFFKAHFFQDPVQPGSLGIEAMVQLLQFYMLHTDLGPDIIEPRFEPLATEVALTWKYRGQVLPTNGLIQTEIEILDVGSDERGVYALAEAFLWVDGKRIYSAKNLGMRIVSAAAGLGSGQISARRPAAPSRRSEDSSPAPSGPRQSSLRSDKQPAPVLPEPNRGLPEPNRGLPETLPAEARLSGEDAVHHAPAPAAAGDPPRSREAQEPGREEILDPERDTWIADHCPTWTLPALPMMSLVDRLAAAARARCSELQVVGLEDVRVVRWVAFPGGPLRLKTEVVSEERRGSEIATVEVRLMVWRDAATPALSRFEVAATAQVLMARSFCPPPQPLEPLADPRPVADPYAAGALFHGPAFQLLRRLSAGEGGSSALLDAAGGSVPLGTLHPALLDAATHGIPHDALYRWCADIPRDVVAYPQRLSEARFYGPPPRTGEVRCEARFEDYDAESREAVFHLQLLRDDRPWADLRLREVMLPKGPLGMAPADQRRAFLRDRIATPGLALSRLRGEHTVLSEAQVIASDWLPGTIARAYGVSSAAVGDRTAVTREVAVKDHVARRAGVHPASVAVTSDSTDLAVASGVAARYPLTRFPVAVRHHGEVEFRVADGGSPETDLTPLGRFWGAYLGLRDWPVEDIYYGLIERFVRRVVIADPEGLAAIQGRSTLFLANHQVGIESLLFSILASALVGTPTVTLAKAEHRTSWLGTLITHCFAYPGVDDPEVIAFFERENMRSLPLIIRKLGQRMASEPRSVAVHCEGTRSLSCRRPVAKLSGSFVDMAMKAGAPIVPVRFIGGLPAEPLAKRIEFPLGHGRQDYWLGSPIHPEDLEPLRYKDRRYAVMDAINALGPSHTEEEPLPPDPEFAAEVEQWIAATGASPEHAAIWKTLVRRANPGDDVRKLLDAAEAGRLEVEDDPAGRWLAEIARRFFGERGPQVDCGG